MGNLLEEMSDNMHAIVVELRNTSFALRALAFAVGRQSNLDSDRLMKDFEAHAFERFTQEGELPDQVLAVMRSLSGARLESG